ncbi:MAG: hypothetical protein EU533_02190 [Promethearchaeota archaeon]|nr:MAG: hypothetical protein EU533_02190 [Candidatus Lokiarchaeota archaeon]
MNVPAIVVILVLFVILMGFFSQDKFDYFPVALLIGTIAIFVILTVGDLETNDILGFINFNTLIFIFAMQIIVYFATSNRVLQYIAIKLIHITKGNNRVFFYMICVFTAVLVAFIEDLTLSLILIPLIYRTCQILRIPAGTYMMGVTICINIGAILTPISSLKNLVIGSEFGWGFAEYLSNMGILFIVTLVVTVFLIDKYILSKEEKPTEENKQILIEMLNPSIVIQDKRLFTSTVVIIFLTFGFMIAGFDPAFVTIISAAVLLIIHSKKSDFADMQSEITWKIIIIFAVLFILSNSLAEFGFSGLISSVLIDLSNNNIYIAVLITLSVTSFLSAFLAGTPVTIILLPIFSAIVSGGFFPNPIIIAFISGVNLAGNFLPQGSACDLLTLTMAKKYKVVNLNYKRLLKNGALFATLHFILVLAYTMLYTLILS